MKKFNEWLSETYLYSKHMDGPALRPHTISAAINQIHNITLAIRTSFALDKRFEKYRSNIYQVTREIDDAANKLWKDMSGDEMNMPHKYHKEEDET